MKYIKSLVLVIVIPLLLQSCGKDVDCSMDNKNVAAKIVSLQAPDSINFSEKVAINIAVLNQNSGCVRQALAGLKSLSKDTLLVTAELILTPNNANCKCLTDSLLYTTVFFEPEVRGQFVLVTSLSDWQNNITSSSNTHRIIVK